MNRRAFIAGLGSAAVWPLAAGAQAPLPVVGFVHAGAADAFASRVAAFRKGLGETGYVEGQNVTVEYHISRRRRLARSEARCATTRSTTIQRRRSGMSSA
jgi:hypothetical protein